MPIVLSGNSVTATALDIIKAAMMEIGALAGGENPSTDDEAWVLQKLQRLIDRYNARRPMIYNVNFSRFTLPTNISPVTIGPGGAADFTVVQRPVELIAASLILAGGSEVEIPIAVRDDAWWADNRLKSLTSTYPTNVYYSPDWPIGKLYFWPIPTAVNDVRLEMRTVLAQVTGYGTTVNLPPAYWDAIVYPLAISLCPSFERSASPELLELNRQAIKAIQANNMNSPRLVSDAPSQNSPNRTRPDFNFLTGFGR